MVPPEHQTAFLRAALDNVMLCIEAEGPAAAQALIDGHAKLSLTWPEEHRRAAKARFTRFRP